MDGLIVLDKPAGITSAKAVYRVRRITGQRKSGHAGTLDPAATGVLLVCLGKATKLVESVMDLPKVYRATARLDVTSASFDADAPLEPVTIAAPPDASAVAAAFEEFVGDIQQIPPAVSALKIGGRPAYELARRGKDVPLAARTVRIYWIIMRQYAWPEVTFDMACGRGTYVRALIRDVGQRLATGGCLTALARLAVGPFRIEDAHGFDALESAASPDSCLIPLETARDLIAAASDRQPPREG